MDRYPALAYFYETTHASCLQIRGWSATRSLYLSLEIAALDVETTSFHARLIDENDLCGRDLDARSSVLSELLS